MSVIKGNKEVFEKEGLTASKVLIDFYADWCGPCKMLAPILEEVSKEVDIKIISINVDEEEDLASEYNVFTIPCLVVLEKGKETNRHAGIISKDDIKKMLGD